MDVFFSILERTQSYEKAFEGLRTTLLKRRLDIVNGELPYAEVRGRFKKILKLLEKEKILAKIVEGDSPK